MGTISKLEESEWASAAASLGKVLFESSHAWRTLFAAYPDHTPGGSPVNLAQLDAWTELGESLVRNFEAARDNAGEAGDSIAGAFAFGARQAAWLAKGSAADGHFAAVRASGEASDIWTRPPDSLLN